MSKKSKIKFDPHKLAKRVLRRVFFERNGDPKQWIKLKQVHQDKKKAKNKRKCKERIDNDD